MSLQGRVILVTGGTSGIGEGCTRHLAEVGAKVVTASIQEEEGRALERELRDRGRTVDFVAADVSSEDS
ncbi:MAG: SDR family NAD(P)-dependent oxidoreductase, partial [Armatimonadetes bacterium]|nr:SDR family NAD(P)-dependent oxidoreductase [Armatimonadota bacterium]